MSIFHEEVNRTSTADLIPPPLTARKLTDTVVQLLLDSEMYGRIGTSQGIPLSQTISVSVDDSLIEHFKEVEPVRERIERIKNEFELYIRTRGIDAREKVFQRLAKEYPGDLLAVGLEHYALHGNGDRLALTAELLSSAGRVAFKAYKSLTSRYRPEIIYFVHGIATSTELSNTEKAALMIQIAEGSDGDQDLRECLESALEWASPELKDDIQKFLYSSRAFVRAA